MYNTQVFGGENSRLPATSFYSRQPHDTPCFNAGRTRTAAGEAAISSTMTLHPSSTQLKIHQLEETCSPRKNLETRCSTAQKQSGPSRRQMPKSSLREGQGKLEWSTSKSIALQYLAGARGDAGEEAAGRHLLVQVSLQHAVRLALCELALHVVGLGHGLRTQRKTENGWTRKRNGAS